MVKGLVLCFHYFAFAISDDLISSLHYLVCNQRSGLSPMTGAVDVCVYGLVLYVKSLHSPLPLTLSPVPHSTLSRDVETAAFNLGTISTRTISIYIYNIYKIFIYKIYNIFTNTYTHTHSYFRARVTLCVQVGCCR